MHVFDLNKICIYIVHLLHKVFFTNAFFDFLFPHFSQFGAVFRHLISSFPECIFRQFFKLENFPEAHSSQCLVGKVNCFVLKSR